LRLVEKVACREEGGLGWRAGVSPGSLEPRSSAICRLPAAAGRGQPPAPSHPPSPSGAEIDGSLLQHRATCMKVGSLPRNK